jgi:hypothetical protein
VHQLEMGCWIVLRNCAADILQIARSLGEPVPSRPGRGLVDELTPMPQARAHRRSLSGIYGLGTLPFHIDTAHWLDPCRYVVLSCAEADDADVPTTLLRWDPLFTRAERQVLAAAIFLVRNGRRSFYACALDHEGRFLRYDPGCLYPVSRGAGDAVVLIEERVERATAVEHVWSKGDVLVIDNWRTLHSRPPAPYGTRRRLCRVLVR